MINETDLTLLVNPTQFHEWRLAGWLKEYFPPIVNKLAASQYQFVGNLEHMKFEILVRPPYTRYVWIFDELVWQKDYPELKFGRPEE